MSWDADGRRAVLIAAWLILPGWVAALDELVELVSGRFTRVEPRRRVGTYLRGLLAALERRTGWTLAEHAVSPDGMQRLLRTAGWIGSSICPPVGPKTATVAPAPATRTARTDHLVSTTRRPHSPPAEAIVRPIRRDRLASYTSICRSRDVTEYQHA
jgi:hypothetical protein